jgi:hypothetical protein
MTAGKRHAVGANVCSDASMLILPAHALSQVGNLTLLAPACGIKSWIIELDALVVRQKA